VFGDRSRMEQLRSPLVRDLEKKYRGMSLSTGRRN
jgi:hypothetical protein